jgi:hypothetical protein
VRRPGEPDRAVTVPCRVAALRCGMLNAVRLARIASLAALVTLTCLAAACGRSAPSPTVSPPADPPVVPDSSSGNRPGGPPGTPGEPLCDVAECGPPIRMPSKRCPDGSIGGPTGRCLRKPDGRCAWEVRPCPPG